MPKRKPRVGREPARNYEQFAKRTRLFCTKFCKLIHLHSHLQQHLSDHANVSIEKIVRSCLPNSLLWCCHFAAIWAWNFTTVEALKHVWNSRKANHGPKFACDTIGTWRSSFVAARRDVFVQEDMFIFVQFVAVASGNFEELGDHHSNPRE